MPGAGAGVFGAVIRRRPVSREGGGGIALGPLSPPICFQPSTGHRVGGDGAAIEDGPENPHSAKKPRPRRHW